MADWPILSPSSLDYVQGTYETENSDESNNSTTVRHRLIGDNLVRRLVLGGQAQFAVEVAEPHSAFRSIQIAIEQRASHTAQVVEWSKSTCGTPVSIRPLVVFDPDGNLQLRLDSEKDGVHSVWHGQRVEIQSGAILAHDDFFFPASGLSIVRLAIDEQNQIPEGTFTVETSEMEGFVFKVRMHKKLFEDMQNPGAAIDHRDSILTGALIAGLSKIKHDYTREDSEFGDWSQFQNLRILEKLLREKGIPTWEDDQFDPAYAATSLKPTVFNPDQGND